MLTIREPQIAALVEDLVERFDYRAVEHVRRFFPAQCEAAGETATLSYVRSGLQRARQYGFESEYDLLRFLNLVFSFGSDFDSRPEYAWTLAYLDAREQSPTFRMNELMEQFATRLEPEAVEEPAAEEPAEPEEFDGIVWEDDSDPNYVPVSIVPEIEPYERGPAPGTVPMEAWEDEDDWQGDWTEEEESGGQ